VTIPASVINIGSNAFEYCLNLGSVTIPSSVSGIGVGAFYSCTDLTNVFFLGNAPTTAPTAFLLDSNLRIYYVPGTSGWDSFLGGPSPVLWNPMIEIGGAEFGVHNDLFGFNITGTSNIVAVVEACTNLANAVWLPVQTITLTNGSFYFKDAEWTNYSGRFYRLSLP
jgi:hypothetical protein